MTRILYFIIITASVIIPISEISAQYQWPFPNSNQQGQVTGSVGEYRQSCTSCPMRFHQGVDLTNGGNLAVHTINSGSVEWNGATGTTSMVSVTSNNGQKIEYFHVNPKPGIVSGTITQVVTGDYLGDMVVISGWPTHVHLQEATTNFLDHNLNPYEDDAPPYFSTTTIPNAVRFFQNGLLKTTASPDNLSLSQQVTLSGAQHTLIYNKVDIVAHAIDPRVNSNGSNGGGQIVPSEISWHATDHRNQTAAYERLRFDGIPNDDAVLPSFHPLSDHPGSPSIHILTSHPRTIPYDRFWNSRLRSGQTETWQIAGRPATLDARVNFEAAYPDGKYTFKFNAFDVDYDNDPNQAAAQREVNVVVDNFRPYVKEIIVRKNNEFGRLVYRGHWEWNAATGGLSLAQENFDDAGAFDNVWIKIIMSEPVQNVRTNIPSVDGANFYDIDISVPNTNSSEFIALYNPITAQGVQVLRLQAADFAGNPLQSNPAQIAIRQPDGTWNPVSTTSEIDQNHAFNTGASICSNSGGSGGRKRTASNAQEQGCLYVDFSADKTAPAVSEAVNFTPVVSGNGVITYNWNFGSGATPASSTASGLQTVVYSTNGAKTVSLKICDNSGVCITETKTSFIAVGAPPSQLTVDFTANQLGAEIGGNIQLTSNITGAVGDVSYSWSFGEGLTLGQFSDANPLISYNIPGNKTISLTVTDANGSVTKTRNGYLIITSSAFNIGVTIFGCGTTTGGTITLSAIVSGGNGPPYDSYFYDFGDGATHTTSSSSSVVHTYSKQGKYKVRITVCDETSCGTGEVANCAVVPTSIDGNPLTANFRIGGLPPTSPPYKVSLNSPVKFYSTSTGGGIIDALEHRWDFESHYFGGTTESANPATNMTMGPVGQEAYYTTTGRKEVSLTVAYGSGVSQRRTIPDALEVVTGLGSGTCFATIGNATISSSCWSASNIPQFTVPVSASNCPVAKSEVIYWPTSGAGYVLPNRRLDFVAMGLPVPSFPLTADFSFAVFQFDGVNYNRIGYRRQRFTVYGPVTADAGPDKQVCHGSSIALTPTGTGNRSYQWTSSPASAINFLSAANSLNPVFVGAEKGTYTFSLRATDLASGCISPADNVTVTVDKPEIAPASFYVSQGASMVLTMTTSGGFGTNTYLWSPSDKLNASNVLSPTFSSTAEGDFHYAVQVSDQLGCQAQAQVNVNASNSPGNLKAVAESFSRISLTWIDRSSTETGFVIQRAENGGAFTDYTIIGANIQNFDDLSLVSSTTYTYRVAAVIIGSRSNYTNESSASTGTLSAFSFVQGIGATSYADFDNDGDLDILKINQVFWNEAGVYSAGQLISTPTALMAVQKPADFDNDGDMDVYCGYYSTSSKLLINNGGIFSVQSLPIPSSLEASFFDYNADNDLDILVFNEAANFAILRNDGGNSFTLVQTDIARQGNPDYSPGDLIGFADIDNDGDEEFIAPFHIGGDPSTTHLRAYINNLGFSASNYVNLYAGRCCIFGSFDFGDFDRDGQVDIVGSGQGSFPATLILQNANSFFTNINSNNAVRHLSEYAHVQWGDYEDDGDLDILLSGSNTGVGGGPYRVREVYRNIDGIFELAFSASGNNLKDFYKWIDYDGDGDLDIIEVNGNIYKNNLNLNKVVKNNNPKQPTDLCVSLNGNQATFSWFQSTDIETSSSGLTYNLYVKQNGVFIMTPGSDLTTGYMRLQKNGNVGHNTSWTITLPGSGGLIEWGVQAIDTQFKGSPFMHYSTTFSSPTTISNVELCNTYTGSKTFLAPVITAPLSCSPSPAVVAAGATLTLNAKNTIRLQRGFRVQHGGRLKAKIVSDGGTVACIPRSPSGGRLMTFDEGVTEGDEEVITKTEEDEKETFKIYPNPSKGVFNISAHFEHQEQFVIVRVVSITGTVLLERKYSDVHQIEDQIDLGGSVSGIYFVTIINRSGTVTRKLLKL